MKKDDQIRKALPQPTKAEREQLEKSILAEGIRDPLLIWNDLLIDGFQRLEIAEQNNLTFTVQEIGGISSKAQAINFRIRLHNQRRNLKHPIKEKKEPKTESPILRHYDFNRERKVITGIEDPPTKEEMKAFEALRKVCGRTNRLLHVLHRLTKGANG